MPTEKIKNIDNQKMDDIIRSAVKEFAQHSYHEASFNRIIKNAKLGKGTMYYYFRSKEDLFMTIIKGIEQGLLSVFKDYEQRQHENDFWQAQTELIRRIFDFSKAQPMIFRFIRQNLLKPSAPNPAEPITQRAENWLKVVVAKGQREGMVRSDLPEDLILSLVWANIDAASAWLDDSDIGGSADKANLVTDIIQRIVGIGDAEASTADPFYLSPDVHTNHRSPS